MVPAGLLIIMIIIIIIMMICLTQNLSVVIQNSSRLMKESSFVMQKSSLSNTNRPGRSRPEELQFEHGPPQPAGPEATRSLSEEEEKQGEPSCGGRRVLTCVCVYVEGERCVVFYSNNTSSNIHGNIQNIRLLLLGECVVFSHSAAAPVPDIVIHDHLLR